MSYCRLPAAFLFGVILIASPCLRAQETVTAELPPLVETALNVGPTALDRYVDKKDAEYQWKLVSSRRDIGSTVYVLEVTSQKWRGPDDVDRSLWVHWLTIVKPDNATANTALLFISGGGNGNNPPDSASREVVLLAGATQTVIVELKMVPNQTLTFHNDGKQRKEDDLIGYTWDQYIKTGDDTWPAQLPMTKSAVRAMDAVQEFMSSEDGGKFAIEKFVVAGGSKRGWTTWLTGIVDKRVCAIAPIVIDVLNVNVSMQHHYSAYGFWAPAIGDYVHHRIPDRRYFPRYAELLQIVDPFAYRDRLTMPKCIINATGDQFFLPDSSQFYFDELPNEKNLCYVPNADHSLRDSNALDTLAAFHYCVVHDIKRPTLQWDYLDANNVKVTADSKPESVTLWKAVNKEARDFRVDTIGKAYKSQSIDADAAGAYSVHVETPQEGWAAYFVEFQFDVGAPTPLRFTTPVRVIPEVLPFAHTPSPIMAAE